MEILGKYFAGDSSKGIDVKLEINAEYIQLMTQEDSYRFERKDFVVEAPMPMCPLVLNFINGERFESFRKDIKSDEIKDLLTRRSYFRSFLEEKKAAIITCFALVIVLSGIFLKYGIPIISKKMAFQTPEKVGKFIDQQIYKNLEKEYLTDSEVKNSEKLISYLGSFTEKNLNIKVKKSEKLGANAFAISYETIIFTDDLVKKLESNKYILSIFFHELGHIENKHILRQIYSTAFINVFAYFVIGDLSGFSETLVNIGYTLISLTYSREFELEADNFAGQKLQENNISIFCFIEALNIITEKYKDVESSVFNYLSTHPVSEKRNQYLLNNFKDKTSACN